MILDKNSKFLSRLLFFEKCLAMYFYDVVYVVVNFLSQVIFIFLLFLGMLMYANEV